MAIFRSYNIIAPTTSGDVDAYLMETGMTGTPTEVRVAAADGLDEPDDSSVIFGVERIQAREAATAYLGRTATGDSVRIETSNEDPDAPATLEMVDGDAADALFTAEEPDE